MANDAKGKIHDNRAMEDGRIILIRLRPFIRNPITITPVNTIAEAEGARQMAVVSEQVVLLTIRLESDGIYPYWTYWTWAQVPINTFLINSRKKLCINTLALRLATAMPSLRMFYQIRSEDKDTDIAQIILHS